MSEKAKKRFPQNVKLFLQMMNNSQQAKLKIIFKFCCTLNIKPSDQMHGKKKP